MRTLGAVLILALLSGCGVLEESSKPDIYSVSTPTPTYAPPNEAAKAKGLCTADLKKQAADSVGWGNEHTVRDITFEGPVTTSIGAGKLGRSAKVYSVQTRYVLVPKKEPSVREQHYEECRLYDLQGATVEWRRQ